jgi:hypothetical protein
LSGAALHITDMEQVSFAVVAVGTLVEQAISEFMERAAGSSQDAAYAPGSALPATADAARAGGPWPAGRD